MEPRGSWPKLALAASLATSACAFDFDRYHPAESVGDAADAGASAWDGTNDGTPGYSFDAAVGTDGSSDADVDGGPVCDPGLLDMATQCGAGCRDGQQSCLNHCHSNGCMQGCQNSSQNCFSGCLVSCTSCTGQGAPSQADCADAVGPSTTATPSDAAAPPDANALVDAAVPPDSGTPADGGSPSNAAAASWQSQSQSQSQQ
jgi:hypothetical protein